jgi:hypothetical protein
MTLAIRLLCILSLLWALPAGAAILFQEDFEGTDAGLVADYDGTTGSYGGWCCTPGTQFTAATQPFFHSTTRAFSGTKSLRFNFVGNGITPGYPVTGGFVSKIWGGFGTSGPATPAQSEIWTTWYSWMDPGFVTDGGGVLTGGNGTKGLYTFMFSPLTGQENGWVFSYRWGGRQLALGAQGIRDAVSSGSRQPAPYGSQDHYHNVQVFNQPDSHWVCYEANFKLNDPNQSNGHYRLYVQDMTAGTPNFLAAQYLNRQFLDPVSEINKTGLKMPYDAKFYRHRLYRQSGLGQMYYDKITISSTRVGCEGTSRSLDTQPPTGPTGLRLN